MKVIAYLIENQNSKAYFSITKILCKKDFTFLAYMTLSLTKTLEHFFLFFWNDVCCKILNSLDFFSQCQQSSWYLLFLFMPYML